MNDLESNCLKVKNPTYILKYPNASKVEHHHVGFKSFFIAIQGFLILLWPQRTKHTSGMGEGGGATC